MRHNVPIIAAVDDDPTALRAIEEVLAPTYTVQSFQSAELAQSFLNTQTVSLVLLDLHLPDRQGLEILKEWKARYSDLEVIVCSGESRVEKAIETFRHGASDYVVKPFFGPDLLCVVQRVLEKRALKKSVERLEPFIFPRPVFWVGQSPQASQLLGQVSQLKGQNHLNVLLLGESGTGKEVVARLLHQQQGDPKRPFVVVNMPALPPTLMESELFGVEKGAFTDAKSSRPGKFELADGGDVFLDEIGDLPFEVQAKLLRTLQERQVQRIGSHRTHQVSFRTISATNGDLANQIERGTFREDLSYRLSDVVLWLPPLRERREDIGALAEHFILKYASKQFDQPPRLSAAALDRLTAYAWPGNVRQLESTIKRALIFNPGPVLDQIEIFDPKSLAPQSPGRDHQAQMEDYERSLLIQALRKHGGDAGGACETLGLPRSTFYRKISQLKIPLPGK